MAGRNRPPNRGASNKPSNRGSFTPPPQPYRKGPGGKGTKHRSSPPPPGKKKGCCPMAEAVRSVKRGKFRLAARYARWSVRLIAGVA